MTATVFIEPMIILHRPKVPVRNPDAYDREADTDPRDPCVWVLEGPLSNSSPRYMRFYATEFCEVLETIARFDLNENEEIKAQGLVRHTITRMHYLQLKGESWLRERGGDKIEWEIGFSGSWFHQPHRKILAAIESLQNDMPAESVQVWPEGRALKGEFKQWLDRASQMTTGAISCNPISIIREVGP